MAAQQKTIGYLTHLRAVACFAIVVLHTFYAALAYAPDAASQTIALTVRNLMLWAVPCFVMVTGTLMLDPARKVTYRRLFGRYILRMVAMLVIFSLLFALSDGLFGNAPLTPSVLLDGLKQVVFGGGWAHMWYLYLMIALYLLLPFYRKVAAALSRTDARYLIGVYLVFLSLVPFFETMVERDTAFYICVYSVYPLYLFLGDAIARKLVELPRWVYAILAITATVLMGLLTVLSIRGGWERLSGQLTSYAFPLIVLQATGIYGIAATGTRSLPKWLDVVLRQIDGCSFGIYLVHMLFLKAVMVYAGFDPYAHGGTAMVVLVTLGVMLCSFVTIWLLHRIPFLRRWL